MINISSEKRKKMLHFLDELKNLHQDDESLITINNIENFLTEKLNGYIKMVIKTSNIIQ